MRYAEAMRTTISVSQPLLENAKRRATERGVTLSRVVEDALRNHLQKTRETAPRPFRLVTVRGKLVNPALDLDRTSALWTADDEAAYRRQ